MKVGDSVRFALDAWDRKEAEHALLHACIAVDGTAAKVYPEMGSNRRFTTFLRDNYSVFGPMGAPGIDIHATRFPVEVKRPTADGGKPDIADVIYGIHRCTHGHGDELPDGFDLMPDASRGAGSTRYMIERGSVRLSDRSIFGLLAVAILSPVNVGQAVPTGYHLTFGSAAKRLEINEWWGRAADFSEVTATEPVPLVKLDFSQWE